MVPDILLTAFDLAANPITIVGCTGFGFFTKTLWRGIKYGFLWGLLIFALSISLVGLRRYGIDELAIGLVFHQIGAVIVVICARIAGWIYDRA